MNISLTKQYTTRSGLPVKLYDIVTETNQSFPVIGAYYFYDESDKTHRWIPDSWKINGSNKNMPEHELDLIEPKPLQEGELVLVWDNCDNDKHNFNQYQLRRFVSNTSDGIGYVTSTKFNDLANTEIWDNCVRLSEFKL